jgi:hypothetical protein
MSVSIHNHTSQQKEGKGDEKKSNIARKRRQLILDEFSLESFPAPEEEGTNAATIDVGSSSFQYNYGNYVTDWCSDAYHPCAGRNDLQYSGTTTQYSDQRAVGDCPHTMKIGAKPMIEIIDVDDDDLNIGDLTGVQPTAPLDNTRQQRREIQADCSKASYWRRCLRCENLNSPQTRCCSVCRYQLEYRGRSATSEQSLLERTRYELLNGRDFWICTHCVIAIPSITIPCGNCKRMISFVPLEMEEFEEFVTKQRETNSRWQQLRI